MREEIELSERRPWWFETMCDASDYMYYRWRANKKPWQRYVSRWLADAAYTLRALVYEGKWLWPEYRAWGVGKRGNLIILDLIHTIEILRDAKRPR